MSGSEVGSLSTISVSSSVSAAVVLEAAVVALSPSSMNG